MMNIIDRTRAANHRAVCRGRESRLPAAHAHRRVCYGIRSERRLCEEVELNLTIAGSAGSIWKSWSRITLRYRHAGQQARPLP